MVSEILQLEQVLITGVPIFLLIDPMIGEPFHIGEYGEQDDIASVLTMRESAWQRPIYQVELNEKIKLAPMQHPYLVALNDHHDMWLANSKAFSEKELAASQKKGSSVHRIGGWIQTTQSPEALALQLSELMRVNTVVNTDATYQRLADRRTFSLMAFILGDERLQQMLGHIQAWHYLEANGTIGSYNGSAEVYQAARLNKDEWSTFIQGELIHTVMARWQAETAQTRLMAICYKSVLQALKQAKKAKSTWVNLFHTDADNMAFASLYLLNSEFEQLSAVQQLLQPANNDASDDTTFDTLREPIETILKNRA